MLVYSMVGVSVAVLATGTLAALRRRATHTRSGSLDIAAVTGGLVLLASLVAAATPALLALVHVLNDNLPAEGWQRFAALGALVGGVVFFVTRVLFVDVLASVVLWTTRRENDDGQPGVTIVKDRLIHATVVSLIFAGCFALIGFNNEWLPLLSIPLLIAALPIYQGQVHPWIEYRKAREIGDDELPEVKTWLRDACATRRIPRFNIRVRDTSLNNAMATAGMFGHLVVVGGGLLRNMEPHELKAIIAHEVAHVVNRDMVWLTIISMAGSACFVAWMSLVSIPLMNEGGARVAAGVALLFVGAAITLYPLTAIFSPRLEFRADRVAATMLGDARPLAAALATMAELTEVPMDTRTWTHPSYNARIEALEKLQDRLP